MDGTLGARARRPGRRSAVKITAVAAAVTMATAGLAAPAVAAPVRMATTQAAAAEVPPVASEPEKLRAARTLGVVPTDAMMLLRDKDFVIALWRTATGSEVRASAELAFASSDLACTEWIKSGVLDANARDQAQQMRDADAARVAREAKERALITIGLVPDPELVIQNDRDFIYVITQRATGARVKAAALVAFGANAGAQKEFIADGIRIAHAADQQDAIDTDAQATAETKARLAAEAARGRAVSVVRVPPAPDIVSLPDDDILRVIADNSRRGSQIEAAAVTALRSRVRADWKRFIDTGVYEANLRDITAVLEQKAAADRAIVEEIRTKAAQAGLRPRLALAAERARGSTRPRPSRSAGPRSTATSPGTTCATPPTAWSSAPAPPSRRPAKESTPPGASCRAWQARTAIRWSR